MNEQKETKQPYNKLVNEKSPYLQQHATNPVHWYPWKKETFELAMEKNKPIFLSIGYSTCHWCHVMEKESFEDEEVAKLLNEYFIAVKVDREERPDIDNVYMTVTQAMTGSGGWPNSIFMTPEKEPFFAGTYFPKHGFGNRPGMIDLVSHFGALWQREKPKLINSAEKITTEIQNITTTFSRSSLDRKILYQPYRDLSVNFDPEYGGFGTAPKFPTSHNLVYLLRMWKHKEHPNALMMIEKTLNTMRLGGIFDQIGFGFHRYATDKKWLVPHFEKMLYDQALLAMVYTDAYRETNNPGYAKTVEEILNYVTTKLSAKSGGFYAAEDADSEGEEGRFYLWTFDELESILNSSERETFNKLFNILPEGNFQEESTGRSNGKNIPYIKNNLSHYAHKFGIDAVKLESEINEIRKKLYHHREERIHPFKDKKILTDWNGLMIGAFAKAGKILNNKDYLNSAERAVDFILKNLLDEEGKLLKRYCDGEAALPAHLNDYTCFVWGLIELYEASFKTEYLQLAKNFNDKMITRFHDDQEGGFFLAGSDSDLFLKNKEIYDGATPSGNSVAAMNLLRLSKLLGATEYREKADEIFDLFADQIKRNPTAFTYMLSAYDFLVHSSHEIVVVGHKESKATQAVFDLINQSYSPNRVVLFKDVDDAASLEKIAGFTKSYKMVANKPTVYLCRNFACKAPITDMQELKSEIAEL